MTKTYIIKAASILLLALVLCMGRTSAQQVPLQGLYNLNPTLINPAFSGYLTGTRINFNAKTAVKEFQEAPKSFALGIQKPLDRQNIGIGARMQLEQQGIFETFYFSFTPSYKLRLGTYNLLSFGMDAGLINRSYSPDNLNDQVDLNDPVLFSDYFKSTNLRLGFGVAYTSATWDIGLSIPQLVESGEETNTYMDAYAAYSWFASKETFYLKPSVLYRRLNDGTHQASAQALGVWNNTFLAQVGYTTSNAMSLAAGLMWNKCELIYHTNIDLAQNTTVYGNAHELMLNFNLKRRQDGLAFVRPKQPRMARRF